MIQEGTSTGGWSPIEGEVVSHEEDGIRIRLRGGRLGRLPRSAGPNLAIGYRGLFRIEREEDGGGLILSVAVASVEPAPHTFDQEFDRLQDALANHNPHNLRQQRAPDDAFGRERIERWMTDVDNTIARLRKHRAKRVNQQT